ncbi:hypothetical protein ACOMHN_016180 [Nucella lapillus]
MVSHQTPRDINTNIRALRDNADHVTDTDPVYRQPSPRMSRLANQRPLGDSMVAYTQRMREIAQFRQDFALMESASGSSSEAFSQENGGLWKKKPQDARRRQRPLSFDELIARQTKVEPNAGLLKKKNRRYSVPTKVPSSTPVLPARSQSPGDKPVPVHISFVSASDLVELVSFSLRSKPSRDESLRQVRSEDSLKVVRESEGFLGSLSSRVPVKAFEEKDENDDDDKDRLVVQGFPSPRDTLKDGQKTRRGGRPSDKSREKSQTGKTPQHDVSQENPTTLPEPNNNPNTDVLREKRMILLHPQKLRHRPKRAKRMALHRSQLTAIPEDERRRQEVTTAQAQKAPSPRMPVIPTSSSLTAIKSTRKGRAVNIALFESKSPKNELDNELETKPIDNKLSKLTSAQETSKETTRKSHRANTESTQAGEQRKQLTDSTISPRREKSIQTHGDATPRKRNTRDAFSWQNSRVVATSELSRTRARAALTGHSLPLLAPEGRARAQRKFSKLIFLRDTKDCVYHKYA